MSSTLQFIKTFTEFQTKNEGVLTGLHNTASNNIPKKTPLKVNVILFFEVMNLYMLHNRKLA